MDNLIQWPRAKYWEKAWNPVIGCRPCSPACENCYAKAWAGRFGQSFEPHAARWQRPPTRGVVFCGNMTDLFAEWVPENYIAGVNFERQYRKRDESVCLWLTKRVELMAAAMRSAGYCDAMKRHYFGFTAENQEWYDRRFTIWRGDAPPWANGWLSAEPLLGPINLGLRYIAPEDMPFEWVVVGCESGPRRRRCRLEWVESVVDQCRSAGVPVFVKQLDLGGRCVTDIGQFPEHLRIRQVPWQGMGMARRDDPEAGASGTGQEEVGACKS